LSPETITTFCPAAAPLRASVPITSSASYPFFARIGMWYASSSVHTRSMPRSKSSCSPSLSFSRVAL
jgi:hypothetical protein